MKSLQYIVLRTLVLLLPALFLVACAVATKSADAPNPVSVFSHNSYTFAPANIAVPTDGTRTQVASIFVNENEVKNLVAELLGIGDDQDAIAAITSANYTLSYRVDAATTSNANTFFAAESDASNPLQANIFVSDTIGAGLSFTGIVQLVPSFAVEVSIQVPQATAANRVIKSLVRVTFQERGQDYSLDNFFTNDIARLSNNITFNPTAQVAENNRITTATTLSRRGNILSEYALVRNPETSSITVFLALRETANSNSRCGDGGIYLDNTDLRVKTARSYDYEVDPRPSYECQVFISDNGVDYQPLVIVADATAIDTIESRGNSIVGSNPIITSNIPSSGNAAFVRPVGNSSSSCQGINACYYANLNVEIINLDELPTIVFSQSTNDAFTPSKEGKGPLDAYKDINPVSSTSLASGIFQDEARRLTIVDRDWRPESTTPLPVSEVVVAGVSPNHGRGAFSIARAGTSNEYQLVVNTTLLDYEAFSPSQLISGKAIYKITIRAIDDPVADGGNSKSITTTFNFEVEDVVYRPLLVNSTIVAVNRLNANNAFAKESSIPEQSNSILVLSGAQALLNQLHRIGSFAAIDPETGDDRNLVYALDESDASELAGNFALINNSPRGRKLIISANSLLQDATGVIALTSVHKNAPSSTTATQARTEVRITVDDAPYRSSLTDRIISSTTPKFSEIPDGAIAEQIVAASVSYGGSGDLTDFLEVSGDNPVFGFAPISVLGSAVADLRQLGVTFNTGKFAIDKDTGIITAKGSDLTFVEPYLYNLLIYVASTADFDAAPDEATFLNNNASLYDVARVAVVVQDTNAAPIARSASGTIINSSQPLTISISENRATAGTEVARIVLSDDNDKTIDDFTLPQTYAPPADSNRDLFNIAWRDNGRNVIGIVTLARTLDYENDQGLNEVNLQISVSDSGEYFYLSATRTLMPSGPKSSGLSLTLPFKLDLQDVPEAPQLMAAAGIGSISESAINNTRVSSNAGDIVLFNIINANEINPSNLTYSVTGDFEDILEVSSRDLAGNRIPLELQVIDPVELENLGDGRTFTATITVRDLTSGLRSTINAPIMIINDSGNDFAIPSTAFQNLVILEQDVATNNLEISGSEIPAIDISRDYDDNLAANSRLQSIVFDVVVTPANPLDPVLSKINALEVFQRGDSYFLRVTDRDYIDQNLFGNLDFTVNARRALAATTATSSSVSSTLRVTAATPKLVTYANAADTALSSPPVYSFSYEQSAYASITTASEGQQIIHATEIPYNSRTISGVVANALIDLSGEIYPAGAIYPTVTLTDANRRNYGNFIRRGTGLSRMVNNNNNALLTALSPNHPDQQSIIINFAQPQVLDKLSGNLDILIQDSNGNLIDGTREFNNYFTIGIINSTNSNSGPQLNITQKTLQYVREDGNLSNYNSLDTLPLFDRTAQPLELNYFIRAYGEPRTASNAASYALAQFSVVVTTAGGVISVQDYAVVGLSASSLAGEIARLQWTNPANFAGTSITDLRIDIRSYDAATGGTSMTQTSLMLADNFRNPGQQTYDIPGLTSSKYYEFSITPSSTSRFERGVATTTNPRLFIPDPPPVLSYYQAENFNVAVSLSGNGATLQWTNPANFSGTSITELVIIADGYANATAVEKLPDSVSLSLNQLINLDPGLTTVDLPLPAGNYYEFSIIPRFYDNDEAGLLVATTGPRLFISGLPPVLPPSYYQVENFNAAVSINGDGATLQWTNPANFSGTSITELVIIADGYANATAVEKLPNSVSLGVNQLINLDPGPTTIELPLPAGNYYEFSIIPRFSDNDEVGLLVATTGPRLFIPDPPVLPPSYYQVENFNAAVSINGDGATLQWTNPANFSGTSITSLLIVAYGYANATAVEKLFNPEYFVVYEAGNLTQGTKTIDFPLPTGRYYEFSITPNFPAIDEIGRTVVITGPRLFIPDPPVLTPSYYQIENFNAAVSINGDGATLQWTNPANFSGTSITSFFIIAEGYANATATETLFNPEYFIVNEAGNLTQGTKTIDFPLPTGRYYEFSITPSFPAIDEIGRTVVITGPRLFIPDPPVLTPSYYQVERFNASVYINGGGATLQWTNPANFSGTSITSLLIVADGYVNATAVEKLPNSVSLGVNQLVNLDPGIKTIDFPLPTGSYYEFSITPFFNDFDEVGLLVAITGPRLLIPELPPVLSPSYYQVENFNASVSLNGGGATLQWTNPANFSGTSITDFLIKAEGYANATAAETLFNPEYFIVNEAGNLTQGTKIIDFPLPTGRYYEFSITPNFPATDEVGRTVATTDARLFIPELPPVLPPPPPPPPPPPSQSYYQVENFNASVSINGGRATLQWTNPANFSGTAITSFFIVAEGYANATATETLFNPEYFVVNEAGNLTQGTKTIDFPLPTGRYYEFSITPFFNDFNEVGQVVATTAPRLFIPDLLPVLPPRIYYQVDNFRVTPGVNAAILEWTNPFNIDSTSITSFNITIRSYADATGNGDQQDSLMLIGSEEYLSSGNKTLDVPLIASLDNRYYEFFIIPTFRDFSEKGVIVKAAGPRILIIDDATDSDRDGIMDAQDVDDDGDGLIDIYTAEQFDLIRNNLAGRAFSDTPGEYGSDIGCGNGKTVIYCNGYELMNNISLSNYVNWEPIGTSQDKYKAIFEGNGNTISNISISFATTDSVGLFSSLASNNKIFNLHLHQVEISVSTNLVGALAGDSTGAFIRNVAISNISISGGSQVGGLLGNLNGGRLYNSSVIGGSVFAANSDAGGLVGSSQGGDIDDTLARLHEIVATTQNAGGLIGFYDGSKTLEINSTYAQAGIIDTGTNTGGILGYASGPAGLVQIGYAYAQIGTLRSSISNSASIIGGHADNSNVSITNSYGVVGIIDNPRPESVGGLASNIINLNVNNSYWDNSVTLINGAITSAGRLTGEQTTAALQTGAGGIFSGWLSKLWDFGEDTEYPALHNLAGSTPAEQRYFVIRRDNP